ncbi:hypothetical protein LEP1GSC041_2616 [Leptospira noguchii str. 2006001870]|nr:hypothetical protein LEP1GSC041_2616 [Leptospira noguchii str. 2006001870]
MKHKESGIPIDKDWISSFVCEGSGLKLLNESFFIKAFTISSFVCEGSGLKLIIEKN